MKEECIFIIVDLENRVEVKRQCMDMEAAMEETHAQCRTNKRNYELRVVNKEMMRVERLGYYTWNAKLNMVDITSDWKPLTWEETRLRNDDISMK